jgi:spectinomycin phosphotransferase
MPVMREELISNLEEIYKLHVQKCIPGPRQVVAETYIVDASTGKQYFCKIIDNPLLIPDIIQSLPVIEQMHQNGINKIGRPIASSKGLYFHIGNSLVVVYDFLHVTQGTNYNLFTLGNMVAKVHAVTPKITAVAPKESFEFPNQKFFNESFEAALKSQSADIVSKELKKLLQLHEADVRRYLAEFFKIAQICKENRRPLVLTHGDIVNNILVMAPDDIYIIDWDEMRLAPAERDIFMNDENPEFMAGYKSIRPDFVIDPKLRRFCILQRYFERMNIYLTQILDPGAAQDYRLQRVEMFAKGNLAGGSQAKLEE